MTWLYFLRNKSKVFEIFQDFKSLVENHIKMLKIDNGGELYSKGFN